MNLLDTPRAGNLCDGIQFTFMTGLAEPLLRQPAATANKQAALYNLDRRLARQPDDLVKRNNSPAYGDCLVRRISSDSSRSVFRSKSISS